MPGSDSTTCPLAGPKRARWRCPLTHGLPISTLCEKLARQLPSRKTCPVGWDVERVLSSAATLARLPQTYENRWVSTSTTVDGHCPMSIPIWVSKMRSEHHPVWSERMAVLTRVCGMCLVCHAVWCVGTPPDQQGLTKRSTRNSPV